MLRALDFLFLLLLLQEETILLLFPTNVNASLDSTEVDRQSMPNRALNESFMLYQNILDDI